MFARPVISAAASWVTAALWLIATPVRAAAVGAVVEGAGRDVRADAVPLRAGDLIEAWSRGAEAGTIQSPFDVRPVGLEQVPRGSVDLTVTRDGKTLTITVPPSAWPLELDVRPVLPAAVLALYEQGRAVADEKKTDEQVRLWTEAAADEMLGPAARCWLLGRIGSTWSAVGRRSEFEAAYKDALTCAQGLEPHVSAALRADQGRLAQERGWLDAADEAFSDLAERSEKAMAPLVEADALAALGYLRVFQSRPRESEELLRRALAIQEREAPQSLALARTWVRLGVAVFYNGNLDESEQAMARGEALGSAIGPGGVVHLEALQALGGVISVRGDYALTERLWKRGLELSPEGSMAQGEFCASLGSLAYVRGDIDAAEAWTRRALAVAQRNGDRASLPVLLSNLANDVAYKDVEAAEALVRQAIALRDSIVVTPHMAAHHYVVLGRIQKRGGDLAGARASFERALVEAEARSTLDTVILTATAPLGEILRIQGDWTAAEACYRRALPYLTRMATVYAPPILHGMGTVERARGRMDEAAAWFARAVEALEARRGQHGGSDEARSLYDSQFYGVYHDHLDMLVRLGRAAEAFDVLELSRARSLLALLAQRDLQLDDEIPPELEQKRRRLDAEYQRTHQSQLRLDPAKDKEKHEALSLRLTELREEQRDVALKVRAASPRLAEARYPEPLPLADIRASLDDGTLLLAYSVGTESTALFAVDAHGVEAARIPIGEPELRRRIESWRAEIAKGVPRPAFYEEARGLYHALLRPMDGRVGAAKRLVISPSGSLHALPFAALIREGRYLAESKPMVIVPSGTILAQWTRTRRAERRGCTLVGVGDPTRPAAGKSRLPESRRELEAVAAACPSSVVHAGDAASEPRAKRLPKDTRYVHFACHAIVNERLPLNSGLVLQAGADDGVAGADDGLLQAWEIYERVRVDADLVTLSACDSGSGRTLGGEGLLGLTRAFQYAGARSVAASLWAVPDRSTVELMRTLYDGLRRGLARDEALRQAQRAAIRKGGVGSRPFRWAGFQVFGDWK